jgi:cell fate regulator YaaT (PSP1 superfamily)
MSEVVDVRIKNTGKTGTFWTQDFRLKRGEHCVVQTERGLEFGVVVRGNHLIREEECQPPSNKVVRQATATDVRTHLSNKGIEQQVFPVVRELIERHQLVMKLIKIEYLFDGSRIIIYYTADGRVDFRGLLKSLVTALRCRIEMRQIGARDAAKLLGGVGICGRIACCCTFLQDFEPVSLKAVRRSGCCQNPWRLAGICGKLRCCHAYEEPRLAEIEGIKEMSLLSGEE